MAGIRGIEAVTSTIEALATCERGFVARGPRGIDDAALLRDAAAPP
jgi:hypothetical protein